jgi:hypothetical protein
MLSFPCRTPHQFKRNRVGRDENHGMGKHHPTWFRFFVDTHQESERMSSSETTLACKTKMKTTLRSAASLVASYDALFKVAIKHAEHHGLDEIRISVPRARCLYNDLVILEKALCEPPTPRTSTLGFNRLDAIFSEQDRVMNEAMSKMGL